MAIQLTDIQHKAFDISTNPSKQATHIKGFAGTGKTEVLAAIARDLGKQCVVLCPTNKAAENLRRRGISAARTIHSYLYMPHEVDTYKKDKDGNIEYHKNKDGTFELDIFDNRIPILLETKQSFGIRERGMSEETPPYALIDESSMVDDVIYRDLLDRFRYVIFFGDPFQLPPVGGKDIFGDVEADIFFTDIHRQAEENPIIRYATALRNGEEPNLEEFITNNVNVEKKEMQACSTENSRLWSAIIRNECQVICGRNRTRHWANSMIRKEKRHPENTLRAGEPIVALKNIRKYIDEEKQLIFFNGQIVTSAGDYAATDDHFLASMVKIEDEGSHLLWPFWNKDFFQLYDNKLAWDAEKNRRKKSKHDRILSFGADFDYAYCLTVHKAQGSEFNNVVMFDERDMWKGDRKLAQRWYYTGITRAKERILIARGR